MREDPYFGRMVVWMKPAVSEIIRYHPRRFELQNILKIANLVPSPPFSPISEQNKRKNRLTVMSNGSFLQNAPKEIHFELYNITRTKNYLSSYH